MKPTTNRIQKEEDRLKKNRERRQQREKQKGGGRMSTVPSQGGDSAMSPGAEPSIEKGGTTRKCANCGMVGHIKTNKKCVCSLH